MITRKATNRDVPMLLTILQQTPNAWKKEVLINCFKTGYQSWVLERDQIMIGFVIIHELVDCWEIMQIAVDNDCKRQGIATRLLNVVFQEAQKKRVNTIQLEVRLSNIPAIQFYQKMGFITVGVRKNYYMSHNKKEDALLMNYVLS